MILNVSACVSNYKTNKYLYLIAGSMRAGAERCAVLRVVLGAVRRARGRAQRPHVHAASPRLSRVSI